MKIAYGKLGSVMSLSEPSNVQGDIEVVNLLTRLVSVGHSIDIVTPYRGELPNGVRSQFSSGGAFDGVNRLTMPDRDDLVNNGAKSTPRLCAFEDAVAKAIRRLPDYDEWIIWLGEHNGPCWPMPLKDGSGLVRPYLSRINLVWPIVAVLNARHISPLWLCPDPRNVLTCNNLDEPPVARSILAQRTEKRRSNEYVYAGIELLAVNDAQPTIDKDRVPFGAMLNEGSKDDRPLSRKRLIKPWVIDVGGELIGTWRAATAAEIGIPIPRSVPVTEVTNTVSNWASTIALPAHCSGWATAKAWEAFAAGTVCFAHPAYDDQDHIYGRFDAVVRRFLRPPNPVALTKRVSAVARSESLRREIVDAQSSVFITARVELANGIAHIEKEITS